MAFRATESPAVQETAKPHTTPLTGCNYRRGAASFDSGGALARARGPGVSARAALGSPSSGRTRLSAVLLLLEPGVRVDVVDGAPAPSGFHDARVLLQDGGQQQVAPFERRRVVPAVLASDQH